MAPPELRESQALFDGGYFRVVRRGVGRRRKLVIDHPSSVAILPLLDDGRVCLIENARLTKGGRLVEIPAGKMEEGESPEQAAGRELSEETGYRASRLERLSSFFTSPGVLDEEMHLFRATGLVEGSMALEDDEDVTPLLLPLTDALDMVADGRIRDAKTILALLWQARSPR